MDLGVRVTHVSYPDAPLLYVCVCVFVSERHVSERKSELGWCHGDDSSFLDLERSSKCPLPAFFGVCPLSPLHTHPHFSNFQSLAHTSVSDLAFNLLMSSCVLMMITHACLKACPSAFCQANLEFVSVKYVSTSLLDQLVCSNE